MKGSRSLGYMIVEDGRIGRFIGLDEDCAAKSGGLSVGVSGEHCLYIIGISDSKLPPRGSASQTDRGTTIHSFVVAYVGDVFGIKRAKVAETSLLYLTGVQFSAASHLELKSSAQIRLNIAVRLHEHCPNSRCMIRRLDGELMKLG